MCLAISHLSRYKMSIMHCIYSGLGAAAFTPEIAATKASISARIAEESFKPSTRRAGSPFRPACAPSMAPIMHPECTFSPPRFAFRSTPFSNCESAAHARPSADGTDCGRYQETTAS